MTIAEAKLAPVPRLWPEWPIELVRLLEECYDIVLAEVEDRVVTMDLVLAEMARWLPGMGLEPWPHYDMPVLRRAMSRHLRRYVAAGSPEGGLEPVGQWGPGASPAAPRLRSVAPLVVGGQCTRGHLITEETLYVRGASTGQRGRKECRVCKRLSEQRRKGH